MGVDGNQDTMLGHAWTSWTDLCSVGHLSTQSLLAPAPQSLRLPHSPGELLRLCPAPKRPTGRNASEALSEPICWEARVTSAASTAWDGRGGPFGTERAGGEGPPEKGSVFGGSRHNRVDGHPL